MTLHKPTKADDKTLMDLIGTMLRENGGLTSTDEGEDSHVLVRTRDFEALEEFYNKSKVKKPKRQK